MGMFDGFYVQQSILDPLIQDEEDIKEHLEISYLNDDKNQPFYSFQTKDLENLLYSYYLKDGQLLLQRETFLHKEWKVQFKDQLEKIEQQKKKEVEPELYKECITTCVSFYDYFNTETDAVSLEFKCIIVDGNLDSIFLEKLERESLEVISIRHKKLREEHDKLEATWEMKLYNFLQKIEWTLQKYTRSYYKFKDKLRKQAYKSANVNNKYN
jgi:hypothetical protein